MNLKNKHLLSQIDGLRKGHFDYDNWKQYQPYEKQIMLPYACSSFTIESLFRMKQEGIQFDEICLGYAVNNELECFKFIKEQSGCKVTKGIFVNCMMSNKIGHLECFGEEEISSLLDECAEYSEYSFIKSFFESGSFFRDCMKRNFISLKFVKFLETKLSMKEEDKKKLLRLRLECV